MCVIYKHKKISGRTYAKVLIVLLLGLRLHRGGGVTITFFYFFSLLQKLYFHTIKKNLF